MGEKSQSGIESGELGKNWNASENNRRRTENQLKETDDNHDGHQQASELEQVEQEIAGNDKNGLH